MAFYYISLKILLIIGFDKNVSDKMMIKPIHVIEKMCKEYKNRKGDR